MGIKLVEAAMRASGIRESAHIPIVVGAIDKPVSVTVTKFLCECPLINWAFSTMDQNEADDFYDKFQEFGGTVVRCAITMSEYKGRVL